MVIKSTWEEKKREFVNETKKNYLKKGYSKEDADWYSENEGCHFEIGYYEGVIKGSVEIAYGVLNLFGFPVRNHQVDVTMTYKEACQLLQKSSSAVGKKIIEKEEKNWSIIADELKKRIRLSYLIYPCPEGSLDAFVKHCVEGMEKGFFNAYMDVVVASTIMGLQEKGFPVTEHSIHLTMSYEEARSPRQEQE